MTEPARHPDIQPSTSDMRLVIAASSAGTVFEWYDFFIYGTAAALVFPQLFFSAQLPPLVALIAAFSTFSVGFVARPVGGVVFGHFGDRFGRKKALIAALQEGRLGGAAIDAWEQEPTYADNPLRTMPNVIATGHGIGHSEELHQALPPLAAENIWKGLNGEPPTYLRNPSVLPKWRERLVSLGVEPKF